jgi:hypothetical protein
MFAGFEVPSSSRPFGVNASGLRDPAYDAACSRLLLAPPADIDLSGAAGQTQQSFADLLPALPLYMRPRLLAHAVDLCEVALDPSAASPLWNVELLARGTDC